MGITVAQRASFMLEAESSLSTEALIQIVKDAAGEVKGGGKGLLSAGITALGATVSVGRETPNSVSLSINSTKKLSGDSLCTFTASVAALSGSSTQRLTVGGLDKYNIKQDKLLYFIPVGPKLIPGMDPYKRFLEAIATKIKGADAKALVTQAQRGLSH
jgi:hypothetical protein